MVQLWQKRDVGMARIWQASMAQLWQYRHGTNMAQHAIIFHILIVGLQFYVRSVLLPPFLLGPPWNYTTYTYIIIL